MTTSANTPPIAAARRNKRALILPGGGMRVAYQAGVVQRLHEAGLRYSHADGTSGGLMNLAALLSGVQPADLASRWRKLRPTDFISPLPFRSYLSFPNLPAFGDFDGIKKRIYPSLGIDIEKVRASKGINARFNICDFAAKRVVPVSHSDISTPLLLAGMSLPLFTPAVEHDGRIWTDAVWIRDSNIMETVKAGANEIWIVWCIGNTPVFKKGFLNQYVHMIEMSAIGVLNDELAQLDALNKRISRGETPHGHKKAITVHLIKPDLPIPLDPDYVSGKVSGEALVNQGYMDASQYLNSKTAQSGILLDGSATQTPHPKMGITFRETMSGRISFDTMDPKTGWADVNAIPVRLHGTINIRDVEGFVMDENHRGDMAAHLYTPLLGFIKPATKSNFQLFCPTITPTVKQMVYEIGFEHEGKPYWFSGRKDVRKTPPWKMWRMWIDTTTLYVKIYEGSSIKGKQVGAGILRLGIIDFVSLLTTVSARDCTGVRQKLGAIMRFASFFAGTLWRTYGFGGKK